MEAERQVRLVVTHPQRRGRDDRLDRVRAQLGLNLLADIGRGLAGVGDDVVALLLQEGRELLDRLHGQPVHDPRADSVAQELLDPGETLHKTQVRNNGQPQRRAPQRTPDHRGGRAELFGKVLHDPAGGGGSGCQDRRRRVQFQQQSRDPLIVRTEVETPVGDAVRLIDDQQAAGFEHRHGPLQELRMRQPLG